MTTPSLYQTTGLSIIVSSPLVTGGQYLQTITDRYSGYQHVISAFIGFDEMSFNLEGTLEEVEEWFEEGLGRDIVVENPGQGVVWEGFVDRVDINLGALAARRGPLMEVANRVEVVYSAIDTSVDPPVMGNRERTSQANDTDSQELYGILQEVLSISGARVSEAEQIRDTYLAEHKNPETTKDVNVERAERIAATIYCLGYGHWLKAYVYNQTASGGLDDLSDKITDVLTADPNGFISTDYSRVTTNTLQVPRWEDDDNVAWAVIKALVAHGDASDNRYTFGIYEDRKAVYSQAPTDYEYIQHIWHHDQQVERIDGAAVDPWDVRPGKWLQLPDFLIGRVREETPKEDPRGMFIEQVVYTAPWGLKLTGAKFGTLQMKLARLGLGGTAA